MMKKRNSERIPANVECRCFDKDNFGTVTDISEDGMFLKSQHIRFPLEMEFDVSIPLNEETFNIPVKVSRITKSNGYYDGIGVKLMKRPRNYLKYISRLKFDLHKQKTPGNGNSSG